MRHWHFLHRLLRLRDPLPWDRCVLTVEQLETRENPAPVVQTPFSYTPFTTDENIPLDFSGGSAFSAFDNAESGSQLHTATLTATNGTITLDESAPSAAQLSFSGNGTATVTITGKLFLIDNFLQQSGFDYNPSAFYSGEATVGLSVNNPASGESDSDSVLVKVGPVASNAFLSVDESKPEVWAPSAAGFAFPPGFVTISNWPDADGSETATVRFSLFAGETDTAGFALFAGGVELPQIEPGLWQISATSQSALQSLLDSLTLVPPAGFNDRVTLFVTGDLRDFASYPTDGSAAVVESPFGLGFGVVQLRFFLGGSVALPPVTAPEGATIDLGGRFVATDPDELQGDFHTLTLSVPGGLFTFNESLALSAGVSAERTVGPDGSTTITVLGNVAALNAFLAAPGSLLYSPPDPDFSGVVPLTVTLANNPGLPVSEGSFDGESLEGLVVESAPGEAPGKFGGVAALTFFPVADHVFPSAADAVTNQDTPVAVSMGVTALPTDPSESLLLVVEGVPDGASFNKGTDLGNGMWALLPADLSGLMFTPAPGASGAFAMTVKAVVTDTAANGTIDTATESTAFTIMVNPVPVVVNVPLITPILPPSPNEAVFSESLVSGDVVGVVSADSDVDANDRRDQRSEPRPVLPEAFASGSADEFSGPAEGRVGLAAPGEGSLFAQPETPLPSYAGGEKHPLPPVLPLDQTSPVAGFTESGGDSFALVDKLYRDAAVAQGEPKTDEALTLASAQVDATEVVAPPAQPANEQTVAVIGAGADTGAPPSVADLSESEWRVWVAGGAVAGAMVAWAWMSHAPNGRFARAIRRLLHPARRPSEAY